MGGHQPRTTNPGYTYDKCQFERDWDARELKVKGLKDAGIPERQASQMVDRISYGPPEFRPRTTRRERYWGSKLWRDYDKVAGRKNERMYFLLSRENYRRALVELRLSMLRPRKIEARTVRRATVNMRRKFINTEHEDGG